MPQFPDPEPDADNDGVPDRWAGWMGDQLGDATNYYTLASLCADADGDGFTGWYELSVLGSNPNQAEPPGPAPAGFVDVVAVVTSSLPCVLRLTGEAGSAEIPWMPGLSPERVRLRLEVGKAYEAELSRVPDDTEFPANGFWWAATAYESPGLQTSQTAVSGGTVTYDAGTVRVTGDDRGGDWWLAPGVAAIPALRLEVRLIVIDGPQTFCHSSEWEEIALASNSLHTGNVIWNSEPDGIEGEGDPLVFDPSEVEPGLYEVYAVSEENPLVWGVTHVVVSHLDLADTSLYVNAADTNLTTIGISGDTYPQAGITVTSDPPGISNLSFRASELDPDVYTVTVGNGSCETREVEVTITKVDMTAYRPQTEGPGYGSPFQKHEVPEDKEESPGVGIRYNGDDDDGDTMVDHSDSSVAGENDLIEVMLTADPPSVYGLEYVLKLSNDDLRVWENSTKDGLILEGSQEEVITFNASTKTVWVERSGTSDSTDLEFFARPTGTSEELCKDTLHFYKFKSVVAVLSGEFEMWAGPVDPVPSGSGYLVPGIFRIATNLFATGYDVHMYGEDSVSSDGSGDVYDEIGSAIMERDVQEVAILGYSHGGGSVYDLAKRLNDNRASIGTFTITFTAYIDSIENDSEIDMDPERKLPPSTSYHVNYYQSKGVLDLLHGDTITPAPPGGTTLVEVDRDDASDILNHGNIDDDATVLGGIESPLTSQINR